MSIAKLTAMTALALGLTACGSSVNTNVYDGQQPDITLREFYGKPVQGYGFFQDGSGQVKERYYATLVPTWHGNEGTMVEKQWNDQGKLFFQQVWSMKIDPDGSNFTATATKVDGTIHGQTRGYAMHMQYALRVPHNDGEITVDSDDWTYLQPDGSGINQISISKYGYHVGTTMYVLRPLKKGEKLHEGYVE